MRLIRPHTGFINNYNLGIRQNIQLGHTTELSEEIFSALSYFADIPEVGKELLRKRGIDEADLDDGFTALQSFLRQSKNFYLAALGSSYRASPLIYYYAFLNLAKAIICVKNPAAVKNKIHHGLRHVLSETPLIKQVVSSQSDGVFPLLYQEITNTKINRNVNFDLLSLLSYCTDLGFEMNGLESKTPSCSAILSRVTINQQINEATLLLGSSNFYFFEVGEEASKKFNDFFEEVSISPIDARNIFGLEVSSALGAYRFFESKKTYQPDSKNELNELKRDALKAIGEYISDNPFNDTTHADFYLNRPIETNETVNFNEPLAIYSALFCLSSLVRYYPVYFEKALNTKDVWIIESFLRSSPPTLLRLMSNYFLKENRRYFPR